MKIRFQASTLRLRLRRSEVEQLLAAGEVSETVLFPQGALNYALVMADDVAVAEASFAQQTILIRVSRTLAHVWGTSKNVGISSATVVPAILIEKDFVRSAVKEPDDFDRFMNPRSGRMPPPAPADLGKVSKCDI